MTSTATSASLSSSWQQMQTEREESTAGEGAERQRSFPAVISEGGSASSSMPSTSDNGVDAQWISALLQACHGDPRATALSIVHKSNQQRDQLEKLLELAMQLAQEVPNAIRNLNNEDRKSFTHDQQQQQQQQQRLQDIRRYMTFPYHPFFNAERYENLFEVLEFLLTPDPNHSKNQANRSARCLFRPHLADRLLWAHQATLRPQSTSDSHSRTTTPNDNVTISDWVAKWCTPFDIQINDWILLLPSSIFCRSVNSSLQHFNFWAQLQPWRSWFLYTLRTALSFWKLDTYFPILLHDAVHAHWDNLLQQPFHSFDSSADCIGPVRVWNCLLFLARTYCAMKRLKRHSIEYPTLLQKIWISCQILERGVQPIFYNIDLTLLRQHKLLLLTHQKNNKGSNANSSTYGSASRRRSRQRGSLRLHLDALTNPTHHHDDHDDNNSNSPRKMRSDGDDNSDTHDSDQTLEWHSDEDDSDYSTTRSPSNKKISPHSTRTTLSISAMDAAICDHSSNDTRNVYGRTQEEEFDRFMSCHPIEQLDNTTGKVIQTFANGLEAQRQVSDTVRSMRLYHAILGLKQNANHVFKGWFWRQQGSNVLPSDFIHKQKRRDSHDNNNSNKSGDQDKQQEAHSRAESTSAKIAEETDESDTETETEDYDSEEVAFVQQEIKKTSGQLPPRIDSGTTTATTLEKDKPNNSSAITDLDYVQKVTAGLTRNQIMWLPVEQLDLSTGKVIRSFATGFKAHASISTSSQFQAFLVALLGRPPKENHSYLGSFWRLKGSKAVPIPNAATTDPTTKPSGETSTTMTAEQCKETNENEVEMEFLHKVTSGKSPREVLQLPVEQLDPTSGKVLASFESGWKAHGIESPWSQILPFHNALLGRAPRKDHMYKEHFWRLKGSHVTPDSIRQGSSAEKDMGGSFDIIAEKEFLRKTISGKSQSDVLRLPVEQLHPTTGKILRSFASGMVAHASISNKSHTQSFYYALVGRSPREDHMYKGFFWRLKGSNVVPNSIRGRTNSETTTTAGGTTSNGEEVSVKACAVHILPGGKVVVNTGKGESSLEQNENSISHHPKSKNDETTKLKERNSMDNGKIDNSESETFEQAMWKLPVSEALKAPVEMLDTESGAVIKSFASGMEAFHSVSNAKRTYLFHCALFGKVVGDSTKDPHVYMGHFWRFKGSSVLPQRVKEKGVNFLADGSRSALSNAKGKDVTSSKSPFKPTKTSTLYNDHGQVDNGKRHTLDEDTPDASCKRHKTVQEYTAEELTKNMDIDNEDEVVGENEEESESEDEKTFLKRTITGLSIREALELPVDQLDPKSGMVLRSFSSGHEAFASVASSQQQHLLYYALVGRKADKIYKDYFWRFNGSSAVPSVLSKLIEINSDDEDDDDDDDDMDSDSSVSLPKDATKEKNATTTPTARKQVPTADQCTKKEENTSPPTLTSKTPTTENAGHGQTTTSHQKPAIKQYNETAFPDQKDDIPEEEAAFQKRIRETPVRDALKLPVEQLDPRSGSLVQSFDSAISAFRAVATGKYIEALYFALTGQSPHQDHIFKEHYWRFTGSKALPKGAVSQPSPANHDNDKEKTTATTSTKLPDTNAASPTTTKDSATSTVAVVTVNRVKAERLSEAPVATPLLSTKTGKVTQIEERKVPDVINLVDDDDSSVEGKALLNGTDSEKALSNPVECLDPKSGMMVRSFASGHDALRSLPASNLPEHKKALRFHYALTGKYSYQNHVYNSFFWRFKGSSAAPSGVSTMNQYTEQDTLGPSATNSLKGTKSTSSSQFPSDSKNTSVIQKSPVTALQSPSSGTHTVTPSTVAGILQGKSLPNGDGTPLREAGGTNNSSSNPPLVGTQNSAFLERADTSQTQKSTVVPAPRPATATLDSGAKSNESQLAVLPTQRSSEANSSTNASTDRKEAKEGILENTLDSNNKELKATVTQHWRRILKFPVEQLDCVSGKVLQSFASGNDAYAVLDRSLSAYWFCHAIVGCCAGGHVFGGYFWRLKGSNYLPKGVTAVPARSNGTSDHGSSTSSPLTNVGVPSSFPAHSNTTTLQQSTNVTPVGHNIQRVSTSNSASQSSTQNNYLNQGNNFSQPLTSTMTLPAGHNSQNISSQPTSSSMRSQFQQHYSGNNNTIQQTRMTAASGGRNGQNGMPSWYPQQGVQNYPSWQNGSQSHNYHAGMQQPQRQMNNLQPALPFFSRIDHMNGQPQQQQQQQQMQQSYHSGMPQQQMPGTGMTHMQGATTFPMQMQYQYSGVNANTPTPAMYFGPAGGNQGSYQGMLMATTTTTTTTSTKRPFPFENHNTTTNNNNNSNGYGASVPSKRRVVNPGPAAPTSHLQHTPTPPSGEDPQSFLI